MCTNGVNTGQLEMMIDQIDDHIKLERRHAHDLGHLASDAGFATVGEKLHDVMHLLDEVRAALDEAKEKIEGGEDVIPFTTLVVKDNLFIESHPGDSAEECFEAAEKNVRGARGADCYAFCYDGYIETDDGVKDALIAEGGVPGADEGYAIAYLYEVDDEGAYTFESEAAYIGEAPNFMAALKEPVAYTDDEIDERYRDEDDAEEAAEVAEAADLAEAAEEAVAVVDAEDATE